MSVEEARTEYQYLAALLWAHPQQCPDVTQACHAWLWRLTEAMSLLLDHAVAEDVARRSVAY